MEQILHLEDDDDIASIKSRIDFVLPALTRQAVQAGGPPERPRLLVVVPRKNKALHNLVNMKVLARAVHNRVVELAIVSNNAAVRDNAKIANVKRFGSVRSARRAGWVTAQTPEAAPAESLPPVASDPARPSTGQRGKRVKKKKYVVVAGDRPAGSLKYIAQQVGMLILIVILAGILVVGFIGLLPQATVTITPVAQPIEAELVVKADPEAEGVDFATLTFPARKQQVELSMSGEIETVKTDLAPYDRATGRVTFINRTDAAHIIPISTTLAAGAGSPVEFVTTITTTIPAGIDAVTSTRVIAVEPGPDGNVGAGQISRFADSAYGVLARVINESPTSGGTLAPAKIIEEADKPRLDAHLQQIIQQEGLAQIQAALAEQEFIPPESVEVIVLDKKYNDFSGDFSDTFSGQMQAVVRSTVIGGYNANRLALAALEAQVPPGYELDIEGLQFGAGEVLSMENGVATFKIFASGQALPVISDRQVAEAVAWLPPGDAQTLLAQQYDLATVPGIELGPEWLAEYLGRLPFSPLRIAVVINDAVTPVATER